jgi:hypothetical protein
MGYIFHTVCQLEQSHSKEQAEIHQQHPDGFAGSYSTQ